MENPLNVHIVSNNGNRGNLLLCHDFQFFCLHIVCCSILVIIIFLLHYYVISLQRIYQRFTTSFEAFMIFPKFCAKFDHQYTLQSICLDRS